jgi:membrane-associated protease RseP (regulator of RpoE activity)
MLRFLILPAFTIASLAPAGIAADRVGPDQPGVRHGGGGVGAGGPTAGVAVTGEQANDDVAQQDLARANARLQQTKAARTAARAGDDQAAIDVAQAEYATAKADYARAEAEARRAREAVATQGRLTKTANVVWGGGGGAGGRQQMIPALGMTTGKVSAVMASQLRLPDGVGLLVEQVFPDGAAERAGFKEYDLLKEFNGVAVASADQLRSLIRENASADDVKVQVIRRGDPVTLSLDPRQLDAKLIDTDIRAKVTPTPRVPRGLAR